MTAPTEDPWFVYLLECSDGTYYCGVAKDVVARVAAHNEQRGAKYTRGRLPVKLVATSRAMSRGDALRRELAVKSTRKSSKRAAVRAP